MTRSTKEPGVAELVPGPAHGWTNEARFGHRGGAAPPGETTLRVVVLNTESGTGSSRSERLALLSAAVERVRGDEPTVLITPAGFFGCTIDADGNPHWPGLDAASLELELVELARSWPPSLMVAIGVDIAGDEQQQWWLGGGGELQRRIARGSEVQAVTELSERVVSHAGFRLLGFVCGEGYKWNAAELVAMLPAVDVVAVSAHVEVNRTREPEINPEYKRWAFQRRFQLISEHAGAALAHARGADDRYVRNCDDWFAHRGGPLFPEPRVGTPITSGAGGPA